MPGENPTRRAEIFFRHSANQPCARRSRGRAGRRRGRRRGRGGSDLRVNRGAERGRESFLFILPSFLSASVSSAPLREPLSFASACPIPTWSRLARFRELGPRLFR